MAKQRELSQGLRDQIIALHRHTSKSIRAIAADLDIPKSSVADIIKKFKSTGSTTPRPRSGRPRVTTPRDHSVIRHAKANLFITAPEIKQELPESCLQVSVDTIKRRLRTHFGCPIRRAAAKPLLTQKMKRKRLEFCTKYKDWTAQQWREVMFSDESSFQMFQAPKKFVRRAAGSLRYDQRYTSATVKHPPSVMAWGCFSHHGRGALTFLDKGVKMNTAIYLAILEQKLDRFMTVAGCTVFQQDSAPCHVSKRAREWFSNRNLTLLDWAENSLDLNPIENLWMMIKRKLSGKKFTTMAANKSEITKI